MRMLVSQRFSCCLSAALLLTTQAVLLCAQVSGGANSVLDSLRREYQRRTAQGNKPDTALFSLCYRLALELSDRQPDSAIMFSRQALHIATELNDSAAIARGYYAAGYAHKNRGQFSVSVEYHLIGLKIAESRADTLLIIRNSNGLGTAYMAQRRYTEAQPYFMRSLALGERTHEKKAVSTAINNLGYILWRLREYDSALAYHRRSLALAEEARDTLSIGISYINFGVCYQGKRDFVQALSYFDKALMIHRRFGNSRNEMLTLYYTGSTLHDMKRHSEALPYLTTALQMADLLKMHSPLQDAYNILAETYTALGRHSEATEAMRRYAAVKDSLYTTESAQQIATMQTQYESEKKDKQIQLLRQEREQENFARILYGIGLTLSLVFAAVLVYLNRQKGSANREVLRQKNILEEQAKEIELANTKLHESNLQLHELNTSIEDKVTELETIDTIVQSINSEVSLTKLLPMLLEQGSVLVPSVEKSSILMLDEKTNTYGFVALNGYAMEELQHLRFSLDQIQYQYIHTKPIVDGVYILREYNTKSIDGADFTNAPPQCSLVMTISLQDDVPEGILFFDNFSSPNAFSNLDIDRFRRFRKHVITAFAKAKIVNLIQDSALQLSAQNQRLQELNTEKNEFLGIAAHDMKSPLAGIMISVGLLRRYHAKMNTDEMLKLFSAIEHTVQRMSGIISNLLDINAIETGKMNLRFAQFDIVPIIRQVLSDYHDRAEAKTIALLFAPDAENISVYADTGALAQVIDNLVSNAVKYSPLGKSITVRLYRQSHGIRLEVHDEGKGIKDEEMKKLFGKFVRLSTKPTGGEDSTGLGLSIVKRLVEAMNGTVWCESEVGKGTTFIVELRETSVS